MEMVGEKQLIPRLPNDMAVDCLIRVPFRYHSHLKTVCRMWRNLLSHPSFYQRRKMAGKCEELVCFVQAMTTTTTLGDRDDDGDADEELKKKNKKNGPLLHGLTLYNATEKTWERMGVRKVLPAGIPLFCQCVAVAGKLILLGGWDPKTLASTASVYIYDFHRNQWRRGSSMSTPRSFFACAASSHSGRGGLVYVAGGHDNQKNALKSAELYHVDFDRWEQLPGMNQERDECEGLVMNVDGGTNTRFYVISGYATESQGRFDASVEYLDPLRHDWTKEEDVWPFPNSSPRSCTTCLVPIPTNNNNNNNKKDEEWSNCIWLWDGNGGEVREYDSKEKRWRVAGTIPQQVRSSSPCVVHPSPSSSSSNITVFVSGESHRGVCILEPSNGKRECTTIADSPHRYSGFVYSASSLQL